MAEELNPTLTLAQQLGAGHDGFLNDFRHRRTAIREIIRRGRMDM
jgi:hypothetical protein